MKATGGKELADKFRSYGKEVYTKSEQTVMQAGMIVERAAKEKAPVDTGRLRASITTRLADFDKKKIVVEVGTSVEYAQAVEYGTSKAPAHPYLFPAYAENKDKVLKKIAEAIKRR
ncbi:MAG: HK97 gp10 family phage protein [Eubacteriales bacterium]|nr:HK97 gp10 family phage protein [Eubacteriales bacterium]